MMRLTDKLPWYTGGAQQGHQHDRQLASISQAVHPTAAQPVADALGNADEGKSSVLQSV